VNTVRHFDRNINTKIASVDIIYKFTRNDVRRINSRDPDIPLDIFPPGHIPQLFPFPDNLPSLSTWCRTFPLPCQSPLTVKHFLIECVNFAAIRSRYFSASSMKDVFESVNAQCVIDFIQEINFYHEL